jgi:hypothetical protein
VGLQWSAPIHERELERVTWGSGGAAGREAELAATPEREVELVAMWWVGRMSSR